MDKAKIFIQDMKDQYNMDNADVLRAIQTDSQHEFIMCTQGVTVEEASKIIIGAEKLLLNLT